jgi:hypothetical protein
MVYFDQYKEKLVDCVVLIAVFLIFVSYNHTSKVKNMGRKKNHLSITINYRYASLIFVAVTKEYVNDSDDENNDLGNF